MSDKKSIAKCVFEKIECQHIKPKPKWRFYVKNLLVWVFGTASLFVGALAVSVIIFSLVNNDWSERLLYHETLMGQITAVIPHIWMFLFALFIVAAYYNLRHTKRGYQYKLSILIGSSLVVTIVSGVGLYALGVGHLTEHLSGRYVPGYISFVEKKEELWTHPEHGMLAGLVLSFEQDGNFQLEDFDGNVWYVLAQDLGNAQKGIVSNVDRVGVIGSQVEESIFSACFIRPWMMYGQSELLRQQELQHIQIRKEFLRQHGFNEAAARETLKHEERLKNASVQAQKTRERIVEWMRNNGCEIGQSTYN